MRQALGTVIRRVPGGPDLLALRRWLTAAAVTSVHPPRPPQFPPAKAAALSAVPQDELFI